jgi:hypothetical protein
VQRLQEEIYRHSEHFRAWQDQGLLSEVQGKEGHTEHLLLYDQDQPEKLIHRGVRRKPGRIAPAGPLRPAAMPPAKKGVELHGKQVRLSTISHGGTISGRIFLNSGRAKLFGSR